MITKSNGKGKPRLAVVSNNQFDGEGVIDVPCAIVPPGIYRVAFKHWFTAAMFGRAKKLALVFRIVDYGQHFDVELRRWYNIQRFIGPPGRNGGFKAGACSDLVREFAALCGFMGRRDRIPLSTYSKLVLVAEVGTVTSDSRQRELAAGAQYSVIQRLVRVEAGVARAAA
jgi:hypothetical protein